MKRVKQYRVRLTEEEDALLKQKAQALGISAADIIRLGIKYYVGEAEFSKLAERRVTELKRNSEFIGNWEQTFKQSIFEEFGEKWLDRLQMAYLHILKEYKDFVEYIDGKFVSSIVEAEKSGDMTPTLEESQTEIISEQKAREEICRSLTRCLGGEWKGNESIVDIFLSGLKIDLARSI